MGGGLAGGSTDAVSTLQALNQLLDFPLELSDLHEIAAGLGSDLNFFLVGAPALCKGRGEIVEGASLKIPSKKI